jgi:hypothetical protein
MIFLERPVTVQHIRDVCARFTEGLRVEYKSTFDANVRAQLPKIVSSFANSQGGVLVVGVRAVNGVPVPPIEGFARPPREELPLTVESICLQNIQPPVLPRTEVVQSDVPNHVFIVIEVDESAEAPHAIENSRKVHVRTGNAANPYDLAEVDLIIDLLTRRREPLERRDRVLGLAETRARQIVSRADPYLQVSASPQFPRTALSSSEEAWEFLLQTTMGGGGIVPANSMKRVPDGAASLTYSNPPRVTAQYVELSKYGLLYSARQFGRVRLVADGPEELHFVWLFQTLLRLTGTAERFYAARGYRGNLLIRASVHVVQGQVMRFVTPVGPYFLEPEVADDYRCFTDSVTAERLIGVDQFRLRRVDVLTDILSDITWAFWQSNRDFPTARLRASVERG